MAHLRITLHVSNEAGWSLQQLYKPLCYMLIFYSLQWEGALCALQGLTTHFIELEGAHKVI